MSTSVWRSLDVVFFVYTATAIFAQPLHAEGSRFANGQVQFTASIDKPTAPPGSVVTLTIKCKPAPGFHTYPFQNGGDSATTLNLNFGKSTWAQPLWGHLKNDPKPSTIFLPKNETVEGYEDEFTSSIPVWIRDTVPPASRKLEVEIEGSVCDAHNCTLLNDAKLALELNVTGKPVDPPAPYIDEIKQIRENEPNARMPTDEKKQARALIDAPTADDYRQAMEKIDVEDSGKSETSARLGLSFILQGIFFGFLSLITPCVFPMIPITVSFFLKQSERSHHSPLTMAAVYCATIVVVMTIAAVAFLSFFQWLSQNAYMNLAIGVLFIVFALSLFGMYELELPSFVAQWTASKESKGGLIGTIFTALTFTILSFACVAPFLGGFGGTTASAQFGWIERLFGGLTFAITFASPFFVLALFPSLLRKLPKSGTWLNSVKVVMGFLELAAAFKFLRLGEMLLSTRSVSFFTYDLVLGLWIALAILCALYLLNVYRLPHDTPLENLGVPRVLLAGIFLCLAFYMLPALFKYSAAGEQQRPGGSIYAWIDAFLLPDAGEKTT